MRASPKPMLKFTLAIAFALTLTTFQATTAGADSNSSAARQNDAPVLRDGRSPDTKDAALNAHRTSRALLTAKATSSWAPANGNTWDGRSPDTKDAAAAAHSSSSR